MFREPDVDSKPLEPGLYLVATPIGNLEDITLRAMRVLKTADLIACEDTRQTQKLLNHFGIATPTVSYHEHNERERAEELALELAQGKRIALVTDAGMPGVSDPGFRLVQVAIAKGIAVIPIPGASAFLLALAASGQPTDAFQFHGFLPAKQGERRTELEKVSNADATQIFYEAPHRIVDALTDVVAVLGAERSVVVARELTKIHEEFLRGSAADVLAKLQQRASVKGEITLLIGNAECSEQSAANSAGRASLAERMRELMTKEQLDEKAALKKVAKEFGLGKSEAYREWQRGRDRN
jgi:16S rRNA (cytidine1402-2'-O)-methyltransferase